MKLKAIVLISVLAATAVFAQPRGTFDSLETRVDDLAANITKLTIERSVYKAIAETDGWSANIRQINGVWCVDAVNSKTGAHVENLTILDDDRKSGKSCKPFR